MSNAENLQGKKVLITGGLGFIGSSLTRRLVGMSSRVTIIDSLIPEYGGNLYNIAGIEGKVSVKICDVRDEDKMRRLIKGQDYLFNLAGQTSHLDSMKYPVTDLEINCRAQLSILEACRRHNPEIKIIFAGTRQIYGKPEYLPVDEKHRLHPTDINGINKMAGEQYHLLYNDVYKIRSCVLRLTNTYGPGMRVKDDRQTFLGLWIRNLLEGKRLPVFGNGSQVRDFNYVDDVVTAMCEAAINKRSYGKAFNLGGIERVSLKCVARLLIELNAGSGAYTIMRFPKDRKAIDIGDYYSDCSMFRRTIGWKPAVALREGLDRTLSYYRKTLEKYI